MLWYLQSLSSFDLSSVTLQTLYLENPLKNTKRLYSFCKCEQMIEVRQTSLSLSLSLSFSLSLSLFLSLSLSLLLSSSLSSFSFLPLIMMMMKNAQTYAAFICVAKNMPCLLVTALVKQCRFKIYMIELT